MRICPCRQYNIKIKKNIYEFYSGTEKNIEARKIVINNSNMMSPQPNQCHCNLGNIAVENRK